jgi:NAD(P)-dependent dehydrogenase (short-subunit alcohol dehydrogenase family)
MEQPSHPVSERFDLTGKVALVTGGSRGLGRAIALTLASAGADVIVTSRKLDACEEVAAEITDMGRKAVALSCHVGKWEEIDALVAASYEHFPAIDVLVNNAGMSPGYPDPASISEELYEKVLAVNLKGPFRLMALVGERMARGNGGSIVNISSVGAVRPTGDVITYAAAKAGLNAMTIAFAHAYGPEVRVNAVLPGAFLTDIARGWDRESFNRMAETFPLRRAGEPDEIAGAVLYLASGASSYTTGALLPVDGGAMWPSSPTGQN